MRLSCIYDEPLACILRVSEPRMDHPSHNYGRRTGHLVQPAAPAALATPIDTTLRLKRKPKVSDLRWASRVRLWIRSSSSLLREDELSWHLRRARRAGPRGLQRKAGANDKIVGSKTQARKRRGHRKRKNRPRKKHPLGWGGGQLDPFGSWSFL